jgi:hypothetical protein
MGEERVKNPFIEMYAAWEKMMADSLDAMLRSPAFVAGLGKVFENVIMSKEQIDRSVQATLRAMNVPSTKDLADIGEALGSLRRTVDELRGKVDSLLQQDSPERGFQGESSAGRKPRAGRP